MLNSKLIANAKDVDLSSSRLDRLTKAMFEYIGDQKISGMNILLARYGKVAYQESFGLDNISEKRSLRNDTIFRIFSMTKPITVVAVMMLLEEGEILLNDPISKYIPEFNDLRVVTDEFGEQPDFDNTDREITIKDLLMHTSGLSYGFHPDSYIDKQYRELDIGSSEDTLEDFVKKISSVPLFAQPGEVWRYSFSIDVLAYLVEVISSIHFNEFIETRIFVPLGMVDTNYYVPPDKLDRFSSFYFPSNEGAFIQASKNEIGDYSTKSAFTPGGTGLVSTISDYYRFSQMLLNNGEFEKVKILSKKSVRLISSNHLPNFLLPLEMPPFGRMDGIGFGFGVAVTIDALQCAYLASDGSYLWGGFNSTLFLIDPSEELIAIVMPNSYCGDDLGFYWKFITLVYQSLD
jgi:CubicO group peptidase (beta-lactamase class C family)